MLCSRLLARLGRISGRPARAMHVSGPSRQASLAYSLYLVVGAWSTVAVRFDMIPAALTLFAVICAVQKRWNWAFALLALATLSKFYPLALLVPFLLALQRETQGKWHAWRK